MRYSTKNENKLMPTPSKTEKKNIKAPATRSHAVIHVGHASLQGCLQLVVLGVEAGDVVVHIPGEGEEGEEGEGQRHGAHGQRLRGDALPLLLAGLVGGGLVLAQQGEGGGEVADGRRVRGTRRGEEARQGGRRGDAWRCITCCMAVSCACSACVCATACASSSVNTGTQSNLALPGSATLVTSLVRMLYVATPV